MTLVAVVGGGQLGQMLALAGAPLGLRTRFLDPDPRCPAGRAGELIVGNYDDPAALQRLVHGAAAVTFEFENVPGSAAAWLEESGGVPLRPGGRALLTGQDRLVEKRFLESCGIPTAPFAAIDDDAGALAAIARIGLPAVLKTRRLGYDGKGQIVLRGDDLDPAVSIRQAWRSLRSVPCVLERFIAFERELSVIGVRGADGAVSVYPLVENTHREGILRLSVAPAAPASHGAAGVLEASVKGHVRRLLEALDYVGVLCIEFFEVHGRAVANEFAPRVHNSGHWSIEGAVTSQFENHLRAILGFPLGETSLRGHAAMVNLIGQAPTLEALLGLPGVAVHLYGKDPRQGRKLGHLTVTAESRAGLEAKLAAVRELVEGVSAAAPLPAPGG